MRKAKVTAEMRVKSQTEAESIRHTREIAGRMEFSKMAKPAEVTERQIVFVASDASVDRSDEIVEIESFYLPLKNGKAVLVADLTAGNEYEVDVPLLTDHNGWEVEACIGSVRKAEYLDGKLIFTCGIASTAKAQEMLKLLEEGHLNNASRLARLVARCQMWWISC